MNNHLRATVNVTLQLSDVTHNLTFMCKFFDTTVCREIVAIVQKVQHDRRIGDLYVSLILLLH